MATAAAILFGIAAGLIAALIEAGILLDQGGEPVHKTSGHTRAFAILVPGGVLSGVFSGHLDIVSYLIAAPATFLVGMVVIFIRWLRASAKS